MNETALQKVLRLGFSFEELSATYGINTYKHPTLPLVGFKYDMIDSDKSKSDPVVRSARGTVLELETYNLVALPFYRFFNYGEHEESRHFNWGKFTSITKEDGSLMIVYFYNNEWHVNTSGSFGLSECNFSGKTWRELFWDTAKIDTSLLNKDCTYIFELCTLYNKVVRLYPESKVYLLGVNSNITLDEYSTGWVVSEAVRIGVETPEIHSFICYADVENFLAQKETTDPTFEGLVLRDSNDIRVKVKSKTYLALHHLHDNGNIANPKNIVEFLLKSEKDEILTYFPEMREQVEAVESKLDTELNTLIQIWEDTKEIESQKDFALAIIPKTKFNGILFQIRRDKGDIHLLRKIWSESGIQICKVLY